MLMKEYSLQGMNYRELKSALGRHPGHTLRFILPGGKPIAADFHVTEVGHVVKNFVDCGGTRRTAAAVVLQAWVARNDPDHRLTAGKLASILDLAGALVPSDELEVEVEYEDRVISQYPVTGFDVAGGELRFALTSKHTDCLAREACGLEACGCGPDEEAPPGQRG
jgi:hypothetical protein